RTMKPCCPGSSTRLSNCAYSHRKDVVNQALTKQFLRITARHERLAKNYQSMLSLVSIAIWLA
ncbi:hypothetical protein, partial [Pseudomonas nitroreducens]|uniref:hypothetical protein n=1 Tax=Pseudomonas nitroreducens TaxID=46680 RepID=UPI003908B2ED